MLKPEDVRQVVVSICRRLLGNGFTLSPFWYRINFDSVAASGRETGSFLVQNDSAFALTHTSFVFTTTADAGVAQPFGTGAAATDFVPFLVLLTTTGSGRQLMDGQVPIDSLFGTGTRPYYWPTPLFLDPASTFSADVQNLDTANARRLRLVFAGYKVFGNLEAFKATHT